MSRQISRRYLLFYLSVSAILACGSARRIPREAACPSCDQNYLKVLPAKLLPWNPHQESNRRDSINPPQNSPYSRLMRGRISQNVARDDNVPLAQNYRRFHQQEPYTNKNLFSKNYLNNSPKFLDSQEIISENKPVRGYPPVLPSRQVFDRPENLFFRNPRHKYSEEASLSEVYKGTKGYKKIEEDPMNEVQAVYRDDRDTNSSWKNSRDTFSSNVMQSEKSFPNIENVYQLRREDNLDEERNAIRKSSNSASQLRLTYPQERYTPIGFSPSEIKRDSYVKDADISKSTKEFFDNWDIAKDSLQFSNRGQFRNNLLEVYPAKKQEIIDRDDNEQINSNSYNSKFPQDLNIWGPKKDEKSFDSPTTANARPFENKKDDEDMKKYFDNTERFMNDKDIKEYFEDESEHYMDDKDMKEYFYDDETERFMNDKNVKEYFDDETEQNTFETARSNPRVLPQNIWKGRENEKLDNLDFMRDNSQQT
ncbi:PREDICTED: uncharacterized protein LOC105455670 [Wasmannia auropunctata]|uniref:uncharacterized protein LOC105455670 n=1 Tax=Wasmannia auropunctata TaxID=64793 RepID=UPI0005EE65B9|nr:PREDICTED: uncharacterized protein LOC105455670 [Wasmannia auropunctata]